MAVQFSVAVRDARLDAVETTTGASPKLRMLTGAKPADCAAAQTGTLVVEVTCPADWLNAASGGQKTLAGAWTAAAAASGVVGYYRITNSAGTVCHEQGTITATGGGGDMTVDNTNVAVGQTVTVTTKTLTEGNA